MYQRKYTGGNNGNKYGNRYGNKNGGGNNNNGNGAPKRRFFKIKRPPSKFHFAIIKCKSDS